MIVIERPKVDDRTLCKLTKIGIIDFKGIQKKWKKNLP